MQIGQFFDRFRRGFVAALLGSVFFVGFISGCSNSDNLNERALFFNKNPHLKDHWRLIPFSAGQMKLDARSNRFFVGCVLDEIRKIHPDDKELQVQLQRLEEANNERWNNTCSYVDTLLAAVEESNGNLFYYETENEAGHVVLANGSIVKKYPLVQSLGGSRSALKNQESGVDGSE